MEDTIPPALDAFSQQKALPGKTLLQTSVQAYHETLNERGMPTVGTLSILTIARAMFPYTHWVKEFQASYPEDFARVDAAMREKTGRGLF